MEKSFWQKRLSRRRLLGASSLAAAGSGAALLLPKRFLTSSTTHAQTVPVLAEDIRHDAPQLAGGQLQGLKWDAPAGGPVLRAASSTGGIYTSPIVRTSFPVTHIGLHWRSDDPGWDQIRFDLRTSSDGATWSPWRTPPIEAEPSQNKRRERFAALVWAPGASYVQYRATFPETADPPALQNVTITALSAAPGTLQASRATRTPTPKPRPTGAATPAPTNDAADLDPPFASGQLISREAWGAPESYRFYVGGGEAWPRMYIPTKKIIVHHTATLTNDNPQDPNYPYPSYTADQAVQDLQSIYYYHAISLGWGDIGYNALIDRFGRVFEGRRGRDSGPHGSREIISPDVVGGHALQWNEGTCGVSMMGNFDVNQIGANEEANQIPTLIQFLTWACRRHYVWPNAASDFLQVDWVWRGGIQNISGHRDVNQTACPGQYLYARLPDIRQKVASGAAAIAIIKPSAQITTVPSADDINSDSVSFAWKSPDGSGASFAYYLEGWLPNLDTDEDYYFTGFTADKRPDWSSFGNATSVKLNVPQPGRYTFHVRARDSKSDGAYEDNWTFVAQSGNPKTGYTVGAPGVAKN